MSYDTSFNGRVLDRDTGYELIVESGVVVARVTPGNDWKVDDATGTAVELAPGQTYAVAKSGHLVILGPGQEWVDLPVTPENPAGGIIRHLTPGAAK